MRVVGCCGYHFETIAPLLYPRLQNYKQFNGGTTQRGVYQVLGHRNLLVPSQSTLLVNRAGYRVQVSFRGSFATITTVTALSCSALCSCTGYFVRLVGAVGMVAWLPPHYCILSYKPTSISIEVVTTGVWRRYASTATSFEEVAFAAYQKVSRRFLQFSHSHTVRSTYKLIYLWEWWGVVGTRPPIPPHCYMRPSKLCFQCEQNLHL